MVIPLYSMVEYGFPWARIKKYCNMKNPRSPYGVDSRRVGLKASTLTVLGKGSGFEPRILDPEWISPDSDPTFKVVPDPDSTLKPGQLNKLANF